MLLILLFALLSSSQCIQSNTSDLYPANISGLQLSPARIPVLVAKSEVSLYMLKLRLEEGNESIFLKKVTLSFTPESHSEGISSISLTHTGAENPLFGSSQKIDLQTTIKGSTPISTGLNFISLNFILKSDAQLTGGFEIQEVELTFSDKKTLKIAPESKFINRPALLLRAAGQDNTNTYRIPGLVTTNNGTLIAVYDNRYNNSKDLQEDIDIGMSRSTDGGQTWQPMRVIMDMGEYGGRSQRLNGIGDPSGSEEHTSELQSRSDIVCRLLLEKKN